MSLLLNWKLPQYWKHYGKFKKPVRIHMDRHYCKMGDEPFTFEGHP